MLGSARVMLKTALRTGRRRLWRLEHGYRQPVLALGCCAVVTAGIVAAGLDHGYPTAQVPLRAGVAWLSAGRVGQLVLVDGSSAEVAARVPVATPGTPLTAFQDGTTGYALNRSDGSLLRVDGATKQLQRSSALVPTGSAGVDNQYQALVSAGTLYALDGIQGTVTEAAADSLAARGSAQSVSARVTAEHAVTDGAGRLWMLDPATGDLIWMAKGALHTRAAAATAGRSVLTTSGGRPVLVDLVRHHADVLDTSSGEPLRSVPLDVRADDVIVVSGSDEGDGLYVVVNSRRLLITCRLDAGSCAAPVQLGANVDGRGPAAPQPAAADPTGRDLALPGAADPRNPDQELPAPPPVAPHEAITGPNAPGFGPAVASAGRVVVPDYSTGQAWVVDAASGRVVATPDLFGRPLRFELLSRDGLLFYNDPDSEQAGVLDPTGQVRRVTKYTAVDPGRAGPPPVSTLPPNPSFPVQNPPPVAPAANPTTAAANPLISVTARPSRRAKVGERLDFTVRARSSGRVTSARWTFGDGTTGTGTTTGHAWSRAGSFPVGVTASLSTGTSTSASVTVTVTSPDAPAITGIALDPPNPKLGQRVRFSAPLTGTAPSKWSWSVVRLPGNHAEAHSTARAFTHTFAAAAEYRVSLTVSGPSGQDQASRDFSVKTTGQGVACGDTLSRNLTLTRDWSCAGGALTITADDVTLDLGGHRLVGPGHAAVAVTVASPSGTTLHNVTIRNGTVTNFKLGVQTRSAQGITVDGVHFVNNSDTTEQPANQGAVWADDTQDLTMTNCEARGGFYALGTATRATNRRFTISGCAISGRSEGSEPSAAQVQLEAASSVLTGSTLNNAFVNLSQDSTAIRGNTLTGTWITVQGPRAVVDGNTINALPNNPGITIDSQSTDARVTSNTFDGNLYGVYITYADTGPAGAVISDNKFTDNLDAGILIEVSGTPTGGEYTIGPNNTFTGNGKSADGTHTAGNRTINDAITVGLGGDPGTKIIRMTGNTMNNSGDQAVDAPAGVIIDGGGNKADKPGICPSDLNCD